MRFGFLFALQPTVITRRAREAVGLFDARYRIGADYSYLANLCRRFNANFFPLPMAIKHEYARDGTQLSEGHLSTGSTRFEFERDLRSEEHTSELQSQSNLVCRLLLEKKKTQRQHSEH